MEINIIQSLKKLEEQENVRILFACEAGSRAWGTNSVDSDYDVRFIYIREVNWYLQLYEGRDVIEVATDQNVEVVGWDLKKALRLLQKSNPSLLEWIHSPIIYKSEYPFTLKLKELSKMAFSTTSTVYHYVNMARKNYQFFQKEKRFTTKRYLNILRPLIACLWILENEEMPPNDVLLLFQQYVTDFNLIKQFDLLIQSKQAGEHSFISQELNQFIQDTIPLIEERVKNLHGRNLNLTDTLNQFFIDLLSNPKSP